MSISGGLTAPLPVKTFLLSWISVLVLLGLGAIVLKIAVLAWQREPKPIFQLRRWGERHSSVFISTASVFFLAGLLQLGFGWVKAQIPNFVPFWADDVLAQLDAAIFGEDPWRILRSTLGSSVWFIDWVYSLWYPATISSLLIASLRRDQRAILAYFLLWGVFGLAIQAAISAAGPIFWPLMGLGNRFDALLETVPTNTRLAAAYLFQGYSSGVNVIGGGISAMPSMHVAMALWIAMVLWRTRLALLGAAYFLLVFVGSVALGWHYFVDGAIGCLGTILSIRAAGFYLRAIDPVERSEN